MTLDLFTRWFKNIRNKHPGVYKDKYGMLVLAYHQIYCKGSNVTNYSGPSVIWTSSIQLLGLFKRNAYTKAIHYVPLLGLCKLANK